MINVCAECKKKIFGRADKRFCSNYCRASFHNKKNFNLARSLRHTNKILRKNRKILYTHFIKKGHFISSYELMEKGFNFIFITGLFTDRTGSEYKLCYDLGYKSVDGKNYKILLKQIELC